MDIRRTLNEVCTAHKFEPDLRTVFVEGASDKAFIDWYVWASSIENLAVLSIETVEIDDDLVLKHGLSAGSNRSRVLALAGEIAERCPDGRMGVLCLVDRDFEDYRPCALPGTYVAFTDCNSIELYAFNVSCLRKFMTIGLGGLRIGVEALVPLMTNVLTDIYAIRLANELLGWGMQWIPFVPTYVDVVPPEIIFRKDAFIRAYLQKNDRWAERDAFTAKVAAATAGLSGDPSRRIRGHDLAELLAHIIRKMSCPHRYSATMLERALLSSVERCDLEKMPLFQRLAGMSPL